MTNIRKYVELLFNLCLLIFGDRYKVTLSHKLAKLYSANLGGIT